jgi:hypothetical protein
MKTYFLAAMIGCALVYGVSRAGPSGDGAAPKEQTSAHPASSEQAKPPLKKAPRPASGAVVIGGPANPTKAVPSITGAVKPAKNTAVINGTGMSHKH